jgi:hypothetical protein
MKSTFVISNEMIKDNSEACEFYTCNHPVTKILIKDLAVSDLVNQNKLFIGDTAVSKIPAENCS